MGCWVAMCRPEFASLGDDGMGLRGSGVNIYVTRAMRRVRVPRLCRR